MRTRIKNLFLLPALMAGLGLMLASRASAQLTIIRSGTNVILAWPTNAAGFNLQSTTNLVLPAVWTNVAPGQVVVNGQNTVTNPISGIQQFYRLIPSGMALIPAGSFTMGDTLDGESDAIPTNVYVSAFYMDVNLVSSNQWEAVYSYATSHGYSFVHPGLAKAANHPVQTVDWYDVVKWSNARSQQAGLTPVYYTDAGFTQVFTNGDNGTTVYANWGANGYRLPTEAEWEKAARGGLSGQRFPWGNTISESQANYYACPTPPNSGGYTYDLGPYTGFNTNFETGVFPAGIPYTGPVGYFAPNGYGLNDMAGNVYEWCWDWYAGPTYPAGSPYLGGTDPRGPVGPLSYRVLRGGSWSLYAYSARCAIRNYNAPSYAYNFIGFRCVRGL
jgi:formylglycine-generating enzyme required for sulfatase activity